MNAALFNLGALAPIAQRLGLTILHSMWQSAAIAALLAVVLAALRRAPASLRYLAACTALATCLAVGVITFAMLSNDSRAPLAISNTIAPRMTSAQVDLPTPSPMSPDPAMSLRNSISAPPTVTKEIAANLAEKLRTLLPISALAWILGVIAMSFYRLAGWLYVRRLIHRGTSTVDARWTELLERLRQEQHVHRPIRLLQSARVNAPILVGWLRPVVLLPVTVLTGLSPQHIAAILAHELAHVRRHDYLVNLVQTAVETVLFYHPAVWWVSRQVRIEREHCCDDLAANAVGSRIAYAKALADLESLRGGYPVALAATDAGLLPRIKRLLDRQDPPHSPIGAVAAMLLALGLLIFGLTPSQSFARRPVEIHVVAGKSIQQAIDAAPDGAVIDIGPGVFDEYLNINKPVTIQGAGWDKTILKPTRKPLTHTDAEKIALANKLETSRDQMQLINEYFHDPVPDTICVCATQNVLLRGLRIQGVGPTERAASGSEEIMGFYRAQVQVADCAIIGPSHNGIVVSQGAIVDIRHSLVAAVWATGIQVDEDLKVDHEAAVHLVDCDIRNCYYTGVVLRSNASTIENCRISGAAWHGISYDNCSPTITGNLIFANARSGIYASGTTHAIIRDNVFWKNEMDAMSLWFDNQDAVERNTIVGNLREGISVLGASKPTLTSNIFASNPIGVFGGGIAGDLAKGVPLPKVQGCIFWKNEIDEQLSGKTVPLPAGNSSADPKFADAAKLDFSLAAGAPVVGAAKMLPMASPWPLQPEETAMIPAGDTRDYSKWKKPASVQ
jgi:parallel beta-helix repeat protein